MVAVDEYVFGYCLEERGGWTSDDQREAASAYVEDLVRGGDYPQLQRYLDEMGIDALWRAFEEHGSDEGRFERNLRRFVRGIELDLSGPR